MFNVLIVDDQKFKIEDIKNYINPQKAQIDTAMDLFSAKKKILEQDYDLIILDIVLRETSSRNDFESTGILTMLDFEEKKTPVIALTQYLDFNSYNSGKDNQDNLYSAKNIYYGQDLLEYTFPSNKDITYLPNLHEYYSQNYNMNYLGCVLYVQNDPKWIKNFKKILLDLKGKEYESIIIG